MEVKKKGTRKTNPFGRTIRRLVSRRKQRERRKGKVEMGGLGAAHEYKRAVSHNHRRNGTVSEVSWIDADPSGVTQEEGGGASPAGVVGRGGGSRWGAG